MSVTESPPVGRLRIRVELTPPEDSFETLVVDNTYDVEPSEVLARMNDSVQELMDKASAALVRQMLAAANPEAEEEG